MPRFIKKSPKTAGSAPGTLVHVGEQKVEKVQITVLNYSQAHLDEKHAVIPEDLTTLINDRAAIWINIDGLHDLAVMETIGTCFDIHLLTIEDIVHTGQRPKVEEFDTYVYIVLKMLRYDDARHMVISEQVSLVLSADFLISFQEAPGDVFSAVRTRLRNPKGRIRQRGTDYLAYALIDAVVDHYFHIMEKIGERIEFLEDQLMDDPQAGIVTDIHGLKREVIYLRKQVWPMRELLGRLKKGEIDLIQEGNQIYWSDIYDHIVQLIDTIESYRDILSSMLDLHLSAAGNHMNEIMKVLTILASIFIPITFIAGVYGMNFKNMPELEWPWGYALVWTVIIVTVIAMVAMFKKKNWL